MPGSMQNNFNSDTYMHSMTLKTVTDLSGNIISVNDAFSSVSGYELSEIKMKNIRIIRSDIPCRQSMFNELWDTIRAGKVWNGVISSRAKDGSTFYTEGSIYPIFDDDGDPVAYCSKRILCSPRGIDNFKRDFEDDTPALL